MLSYKSAGLNNKRTIKHTNSVNFSHLYNVEEGDYIYQTSTVSTENMMIPLLGFSFPHKVYAS